MSDVIIPTTAICAGCNQQRGDHSGGSFLCPDTPAHADNRFHFTDNAYVHGDE